MKAVHSLQFKISAALFCVGAVLIVLNTLRVYQRSVQVRRESLRTFAFTEGSRLSGMSQHLLRRGASRAADLEMSYSSANPDLLTAGVVDGENIVRHATSEQWKGLPIAETPLRPYAGLVNEVRATMEGRVVELRGQNLMVAAFPFWEGLARAKGCVVAAYDLEAPLAVASANALYSSLGQAMALAGGSLALWMMLKLVVTERVGGLVAQVQGVSLEAEPVPMTQVSKAIVQTHRRLRTSERRFQQIAATMRDTFWIAPADPQQPPYVNEAYRRLLGRDESRLTRSRWDWLRAVAKEDRRRCLEMLAALRKGRDAEEVEARVQGPDGTLRWIRCRGVGVIDEPRERLSVAGIAMDVSERKMLERRLLDATEKERRRIGMDLHDDLCQRLAAALMKTGVLTSALAKAGSPQEALATELADDLSNATGLARGFARGLAPVGMEALGLPAALSDLGDFISNGFKVPCRVEYNVEDDFFQGESATHIFRVAQELATNAAKHARPTWIEINFETMPDHARLMISHDGTGYRPDGEQQNAGMGMHMVRQRLDALGASLTHHSSRQEDGFTCVECLIPMPQIPENPNPA
jgi:PAS domain S-box-containing protein